jgi:hypothetical protein
MCSFLKAFGTCLDLNDYNMGFSINFWFSIILRICTYEYDGRYFEWGEAIYRVGSESKQEAISLKELRLKTPPGVITDELGFAASNPFRLRRSVDYNDDKVVARAVRGQRDLTRGFLLAMWEDEKKSMSQG